MSGTITAHGRRSYRIHRLELVRGAAGIRESWTPNRPGMGKYNADAHVQNAAGAGTLSAMRMFIRDF